MEVARSLNWKYMDHELVNRAAREAGVPEVALAHIDELGLLGLRPSPQESRAYLNRVETIIRELADDGNVVIAGCAGQVVLANHPQALHVQIVAPFEIRIIRLMEQDGISEAAAMKRLLKSDKRRSRYLKRNYGVDWLDPSLHDLIINTARITRESAVSCIIQLMRP
jgi:cytidylate kinase